jgi:hypothetical protein
MGFACVLCEKSLHVVWTLPPSVWICMQTNDVGLPMISRLPVIITETKTIVNNNYLSQSLVTLVRALNIRSPINRYRGSTHYEGIKTAFIFLYTSGKCKIHDTWRRRKNYIASEEYPVTFNYFCLPQLHCSSGWVTTTRPNITYSSPNWAHTCCNNKWKKSAGRSFEKRSCKVFPSCGQSLGFRLQRTNRQCISNVAVTHRGLRGDGGAETYLLWERDWTVGSIGRNLTSDGVCICLKNYAAQVQKRLHSFRIFATIWEAHTLATELGLKLSPWEIQKNEHKAKSKGNTSS